MCYYAQVLTLWCNGLMCLPKNPWVRVCIPDSAVPSLPYCFFLLGFEKLVPGNTWGHLEILGDTLRYLGIPGDTLGHLEILGDTWRNFGTIQDIWGHLWTIADTWEHLGTLGDAWGSLGKVNYCKNKQESK